MSAKRTKRPPRHLDATADALLVASRALIGIAARSLPDPDDVTLQQFRALVVLSRVPSLTATELSESLGVHQSSTTRLCDRLVRKELVERSNGIEDRRLVVLSLTPEGRRLVEDVSQRRRRELRAIAGKMDGSSRHQALEGLLAFADAAGEPDPGSDLFAWPEA